MRAVLVSFFGSSNIGDLLISSSLKNKVEQYADVESIDYLGNNVVDDMDIEAPFSEYTLKNKTKDYIKHINGKLYINQILMRLKKRVSMFSYPTFDEEISKADALIIGGGNMVFDLASDTISAKRFDYYVTKAKELGLPVMAISLGIGPFHNKYQQKYAVEALAKCDYITFRDNKSYKLFKEFNTEHKNVEVVPDPVFFMEESTIQGPNDKIGLNIINPELFGTQFNRTTIKKDYISLINKLLESFDEKIMIYNTEAKDFNYCQEIFNEINSSRVELVKVNSLTDLYNVYSHTKIIVGTRMHSLITSFSQGKPIVGLSWQQKVDGMFDLLNDSESCFRLKELSEDIDGIINQVSKKLDMTNEHHIDTMNMLKSKEKINHVYLQNIFNKQLKIR